MSDPVQEPELFHRMHARLVFDRPTLVEWLGDYFCFDGKQGTYAYHLTRCKSAFHVGTVSLDDFVEFDEETLEDLADFLLKKLMTY